MAAPPGHRFIAAALALLVTAGIVALIVAGTGERQASVVAQAPSVSERYCASGADADLPPQHGDTPHVGHYANPVYGYAVTIPAGLTGYTRAGAAPRGFSIALAGSPPAMLSADAAYDALYDITAAGVHLRDTVDVRLFDRLVADQAAPYSLAGAAGGRYRMQVACPGQTQVPGQPQLRVFEDVIVVRNREIYRVQLQSTPARLARDEPLLDQMLGSWRWIP